MTDVNASKSHIRDESYLNLDCGFSEDAPFLSFPRVEKSNGKWDTHKFASQISTASEFQPIFGKNPCQKSRTTNFVYLHSNNMHLLYEICIEQSNSV